jgi:hypothetical protein
LHERLNEQAEWEDYMQTLRVKYAKLPALHDELRKAKV